MMDIREKKNKNKEMSSPPITTHGDQDRLPLKPPSIIYTLITLINMAIDNQKKEREREQICYCLSLIALKIKEKKYTTHCTT